jgi:SAM-dependent methyltransferase
MIFADGIPEQSVFDRYYRERSKYDKPRVPEAEARRIEQTANDIEQFVVLRASRILDVGCGSGTLLAELSARGCEYLCGMDLSPHAGGEARDLGIEVYRNSAGEYDAILLIGVLEHIRDLDPAMEHVSKLLAPHGRIFVEVPDCSAFSVEDAPFQEFSTEHVNFFTGESLRNFMSLRGFYRRAGARTTRPAFEGVGTVTWGVFEKRWEHLRIKDYIRDSTEREKALAEKIAALPKPLIVWGVGTHTLHLIGAGVLKTADVACFVDSSQHYQKQSVEGVGVVHPNALGLWQDMGHEIAKRPILICTRGFQNEIEAQIKSMELPNPVIKLY